MGEEGMDDGSGAPLRSWRERWRWRGGGDGKGVGVSWGDGARGGGDRERKDIFGGDVGWRSEDLHVGGLYRAGRRAVWWLRMGGVVG